MRLKSSIFASLVLIVAMVLSGCATPSEVERTIDLVTTHSQNLNKQLKGFNKTHKEISKLREDRIVRLENSAKEVEAKTAGIYRRWEIEKNKSALHLFKTLKKTRPKVSNIDLGKSGVSSTGGDAVSYDPKPIENMEKKLKEIKEGKSFWDQVEFVFDFAEGIGNPVENNQKKANETAKKGETKEKGIISK